MNTLNIDKERAIEIFEEVANDSYVCVISDAEGKNKSIATDNGTDMSIDVDGNDYKVTVENADQDDAKQAYDDAVDANILVSDGMYDEYTYYKITLILGNNKVIAYVPQGGW